MGQKKVPQEIVARIIAAQKERQLMQIANLSRSGTGGGKVTPTERRMVNLQVPAPPILTLGSAREAASLAKARQVQGLVEQSDRERLERCVEEVKSGLRSSFALESEVRKLNREGKSDLTSQVLGRTVSAQSLRLPAHVMAVMRRRKVAIPSLDSDVPPPWAPYNARDEIDREIGLLHEDDDDDRQGVRDKRPTVFRRTVSFSDMRAEGGDRGCGDTKTTTTGGGNDPESGGPLNALKKARKFASEGDLLSLTAPASTMQGRTPPPRGLARSESRSRFLGSVGNPAIVNRNNNNKSNTNGQAGPAAAKPPRSRLPRTTSVPQLPGIGAENEEGGSDPFEDTTEHGNDGLPPRSRISRAKHTTSTPSMMLIPTTPAKHRSSRKTGGVGNVQMGNDDPGCENDVPQTSEKRVKGGTVSRTQQQQLNSTQRRFLEIQARRQARADAGH